MTSIKTAAWISLSMLLCLPHFVHTQNNPPLHIQGKDNHFLGALWKVSGIAASGFFIYDVTFGNTSSDRIALPLLVASFYASSKETLHHMKSLHGKADSDSKIQSHKSASIHTLQTLLYTASTAFYSYVITQFYREKPYTLIPLSGAAWSCAKHAFKHGKKSYSLLKRLKKENTDKSLLSKK